MKIVTQLELSDDITDADYLMNIDNELVCTEAEMTKTSLRKSYNAR